MPVARAAWALVAIVLVGYLVVARVVGDVYPFSTFSMYGGAMLDSSSRIVVRTADGSAVEIESFEALACERPVDVGPLACAHEWPYAHFPSVDAEAARALAERERTVDGGETVTIVRRIWRFDADGRAVASDCELAHCEGAR